MGTTKLVSVEEYLRTSFPDADREYVDGRIVERNVGEVDDSDVQSSIPHYLRTHYKKEHLGRCSSSRPGEEDALPDSRRHGNAGFQACRAGHS
jgi:hypothetical protein